MQEAIAEALEELDIVETSPDGNLKLIQIQETEGRGLGTFAAQDIPKGTRILSECPLLELPPPGMNREHWAQDATDRFGALPSEEQAVLLNLHCQMEKRLLQRLAVEAIKSGEIGPEELRISEASDIQDIPEGPLKRKIRVAGTFQTNAFGLSGEDASNVHVAIFESASRINHSCAPNTWHSWNPKTEKHNIHAIRDIKAGEELTTEYANCLDIREKRHSILKSYGFECQCEVCNDNEAELRRVKIQSLKNDEFGQYKQQLKAGGQLSGEDIRNALDSAKALLALYEEEGSVGIHEEEILHFASLFSGANRNYHEAAKWCKSWVVCLKDCLGEDHPAHEHAVKELEWLYSKL